MSKNRFDLGGQGFLVTFSGQHALRGSRRSVVWAPRSRDTNPRPRATSSENTLTGLPPTCCRHSGAPTLTARPGKPSSCISRRHRHSRPSKPGSQATSSTTPPVIFCGLLVAPVSTSFPQHAPLPHARAVPHLPTRRVFLSIPCGRSRLISPVESSLATREASH